MHAILEEAIAMKDELIANRRYLHQHPEIKDDLPITSTFVKEKLTEYGIPWQEISKCGIVGIIEGKQKGKVAMLRADMDALDIKEESGLPFCSLNNYGHCCGHDLHTTMLLGAAKILSKHKDELKGTVKLMFQPGEEYFIGSKAMIAAGVLENPTVDAAFDMHMNARLPVGTIAYCKGYTCASCDGFKITVIGKGCHGAWPDTGIDPINTAIHIHLAFQELMAREVPSDKMATLTIGQFIGGTTANIIPNSVVMQGTLRCFDPNVRKNIYKRMHEICDYVCKTYRSTYEYEVLSEVPSLYTTPKLEDLAVNVVKELGLKLADYKPSSASDDFARITEHVPSTFLSIGCQPYGDGPTYPPHNPKIRFNEDALPNGTAIHVLTAMNFLNK